jgi:hypothetical protein
MKKILFSMALALMSVMVSAQSVKPYPVYCNVVGYNWFGVGKIKVELDMGRFTKGKGESLYEANGKKKKFHTMMSVLNYMGERGWKCVDTYFLSFGNDKVIHYLLEKYITSPEQMTEGLILKEESEELYLKQKEEYEKNRRDDAY